MTVETKTDHMNCAKVEINNNSSLSRVTGPDGRPWEGVTSITVSQSAMELPTAHVTIELIDLVATIFTNRFTGSLDSETRATLERLPTQVLDSLLVEIENLRNRAQT